MKISVRDAEALRAVSPADVEVYLENIGATFEDKWGDKAHLWNKALPNGNLVEFLVPIKKELGDYATRMSEILAGLEEVTGLSQLQILSSLGMTNADVVRIRAISPIVEDGTIPLREGKDLLNSSYNMMMAAASATVEVKPVYHSHKPDNVVSFMNNIRLGQTERGSFVLTLVSPVVSQKVENGEPFERTVTTRLALSLNQAIKTAHVSENSGDLEPFRNVVGEGVNANLCESLVGIYNSVGTGEIQINLAWSQGRQSPLGVPQSVSITSRIVPTLQAASKFYRQVEKPNTVPVKGFILKMGRPRFNARGGVVTLQSYVHSAWRQIKTTLPHDDYQQAIIAHEKYRPVICRGHLVRMGTTYTLKNPTGFRILRPEEFDAGEFEQAVINPQPREVGDDNLSLFDSEL